MRSTFLIVAIFPRHLKLSRNILEHYPISDNFND